MAWTSAQLAALQEAKQKLLTGSRVVEVEHASGKRLRYQQSNLADLNAAIREAEIDLGMAAKRRTINVMTSKGAP